MLSDYRNGPGTKIISFSIDYNIFVEDTLNLKFGDTTLNGPSKLMLSVI